MSSDGKKMSANGEKIPFERQNFLCEIEKIHWKYLTQNIRSFDLGKSMTYENNPILNNIISI